MTAPPNVDAARRPAPRRGLRLRGHSTRGRAYADEDRVTVLSSEPGLIKAVCRGSGRAAYVVWIRWSRAERLRQRRRHVQLPARRRVQALRRRHPHRPPTGRRRRESAVASERRGRLAPGPRRPGHGRRRSTTARRRPASPCRSRWSTPLPAGTSTSTGPRVTIRPMRTEGKGGQWIKTGASWRDIASPYGHPLTDVDPLQRAALKSLMASGAARPRLLEHARPRRSPGSAPISGTSSSGPSRSASS